MVRRFPYKKSRSPWASFGLQSSCKFRGSARASGPPSLLLFDQLTSSDTPKIDTLSNIMLAHLAILLSAVACVVAAPLEERASDLTNSAVTLAAPAPRLWRDASDSAQPCGGIAFNGTRTNWPLCNFRNAHLNVTH